MADLTKSEALGASYATLAFFFIAAICVALLPQFRKTFGADADSYLAARKTMGPIRLGVSFFAGAMGAWVVYGVPEVGTLLGPWGIMGYTLSLIVPFVGVAWLAPRLTKMVPNGFTALEFAQKRFGTTMYYFTLLVSIFYMFIYIVAEYTAAGSAISAMTGYALEDGWQVTLGVALISSAYTAYGGLAVSIFTDLFQGVIVFILVILGCAAGFASADASASAIKSAAQWTDGGFGALIALVLALAGASAFDQSLWQRAYAAKDSRSLWLGVGVGVSLITPVMIIFGLAGVVAMAEYPEDAAGAPFLSFFFLVGSLGKGWKGILVVLVVALVCSTADSIQNALTTIIAVEVEKVPVPFLQENKITTARIIALLIQGPAIGFALGDVDVLRMFLVADLITAAIVVPLFAGLWGFMTQIGAVSGVIAGFGSVIIQGWELRKAIAQGFEQIGLPKGLYSDETVVSFVLAVASSAVVGFGVSALERMYANTVRTRRYVELLADAGNVDLASHEHEFVNLVDFKGGKNVDSTEGSVEAEV